MGKLKGMWENKWIRYSVIVIIAIIIGFGSGNSSAKEELEGQKLTAEELLAEIDELEKEKDNLNDDIQELEKEISKKEKDLEDVKAENEEVLALVDNKNQLEKDVDNAKSELDSIQSDIDSANSNLGDIQDRIAKASGTLQKLDKKPIKLSAGQYFVGQDFPSGRYKAQGSSNFFVYDSGGSNIVNTILGGGSVGRGDYVFFAEDGYYVESSAPVTLVPVQ